MGEHANALPNILLLLTDQFRYDAFGPATTPNLYKLAQSRSAVTFSNAYVSTPTCTPARAGLLTGKSPWNHGMLGYASSVDCQDYPQTLPSGLGERLGYQTIVVGKNHFGISDGKFISHGYQSMELYDGLTELLDDYDLFFDAILPGVDPLSTCNLKWNDWKSCPYAFEEYLHPTAWTTREALKIIDEKVLSKEKSDNPPGPIFLKVSYHRPHSPYDPPPRFWGQHESRKNDPAYKRNRCYDDPSKTGSNATSCWDQEFVNATGPMPHDAWQGDPGEKAARTSRAAYLANVEFVDEGIGRILDRLGDSLDNTLVVWMSDHGDMNGDHNLWRKGYPWEASSHVNLLIQLPKDRRLATGGIATSQALVEIRDVAPTIYDVLGILKNITLEDPLLNGKSLLPILNGNATDVRQYLDLEHSLVYDDRIHWNAIVGKLPSSVGNPRNSANSTKANTLLYKYIFFAKDGKEQLFCLTNDPTENHDLSKISSYEPTLVYWRTILANQFREEGRGEEWVTPDGGLVVGRRGIVYGPNYPCRPPKITEIGSTEER